MTNPPTNLLPRETTTASKSSVNHITQFLVTHGGPVLFAVVFVEQAGLPLASAPWLLAAGALSASGKLSPGFAVGVTALAAVMADSLWFYTGRRGGQRVLRLFCRLSLARNSCVGRTEDLFARYGVQALVAAKFLPGLGTVMPPLAGALGMRTGRFLFFDGLGSLFYGAFYVVVGFVFHNQLSRAIAVLAQVGFSALLLIFGLVLGYVVFRYFRRSHTPTRATRHETRTAPKGHLATDQAAVLAARAQPVAIGSRAQSSSTAAGPHVVLALTSGSKLNARADARLAGHAL